MEEAEQAAQIEERMAAGAIDPPLEIPTQDNRTSLLALILMTVLEVIETYPVLPQLLTILSTMFCFCQWVESMQGPAKFPRTALAEKTWLEKRIDRTVQYAARQPFLRWALKGWLKDVRFAASEELDADALYHKET